MKRTGAPHKQRFLVTLPNGLTIVAYGRSLIKVAARYGVTPFDVTIDGDLTRGGK